MASSDKTMFYIKYPQLLTFICDELFKIWAELQFWNRMTRPTEGCWEWTHGINSGGYGSFRRPMGDTTQAHIYAFAIHHELLDAAYNPIVSGLVLHKCNNRKCSRPDHLYNGTYKDNFDDTNRSGKYNSGACIEDFMSYEEILELKRQGLSSIQISDKLGDIMGHDIKFSPRGVRQYLQRKAQNA